MSAVNDLQKDLATEPPVDINQYLQKEGLVDAPKPKTITIPEAAQLMQPQAPAGASPSDKGAIDGGTNFGKDVGSAIQGGFKGLGDLAQGMWNTGIDVANGLSRFATAHGVDSGDLISDNAKMDWTKVTTNANDPTAEKLARGLVRYGAPVAGLMASGVGGVAAIAAGAGVDATILDPHQERLANLVQNEFPEVKNIAILGSAVDWLADHKNESDSMGRVKNAVEAAGVGGALEAFLGTIKASKLAYQYMKAAAPAAEGAAPAAAEAAAPAAGAASAETGSIPIEEASTPDNLRHLPNSPQSLRARLQKQLDGLDTHPLLKDDPVALESTRARLTKLINSLSDEHPIFSDSPTMEGSDLPNPSNSDNVTIATHTAAQVDPKELQYVPRTKAQTTAELQALIDDPKTDERLMAKIKNNEPFTGAEIEYGKWKVNRMTDAVLETAKRASEDPSVENLAALADAHNNLSVIHAAKDKSGSITGADLNMQKIYKNFSAQTLSQADAEEALRIKSQIIQKMVDLSGGKENLKDVADKIAAVHALNKDEAGAMLAKMNTISRGSFKKFQDTATHWTINSMLSSLHTFVHVAASNAYTTGSTIIEHGIAMVLPGFMGGEAAPMAQRMARAGNFVRGQMDALLETFQGVAHALGESGAGFGGEVTHFPSPATPFKGDGVPTYKVSFNATNPITAENYGVDPTTLLGKTLDRTGMVVGIPGKLAGAHDSFFGNMVYRGKLQELAFDATKGLEESQRDAAIAQFMKDPPIEAHEAAVKYAQEGTFLGPWKDNWMGKAGQTAQDWLHNNIPMGDMLMPFLKIGANIAEYTYNHSPFKYLAAEVAPRISSVFGKPSMGAIGSGERALAMAKIYHGSLTMAGLGYLASKGVITGDEPANYAVGKALRESNENWQPNSVKIGDTYYSLKGIEPLTQFARIGAMASELTSYLTKGEFGQMAPLIAGTLVENFTPEQMIENTGRLSDMIRGVMHPEDHGHPVQSFMADLVNRPVPALLRDVRNATDIYQRDTTGDHAGLRGSIDKIMNTFQNRVPGWSKDLPVTRNIFGEPLLVNAVTPKADVSDWEDRAMSMVSPFATSSAKGSEVHQAMTALAQYYEERSPVDSRLMPLQVSMPSRTFKAPGTGTMLKLDGKEYEKLVMYTAGLDPDTAEPLPGQKTLREQMEEAAVPLYERLKLSQTDKEQGLSYSDYNRAVGNIAKILNDAKKRGKQALLADPAFYDRWTKAVQANDTQAVGQNVMQ